MFAKEVRMKKPLWTDLTLICAVSMAEGLKQYRDYIAEVPDDTIKFVQEWSAALRSVARMKFYDQNLGSKGRAVAWAPPKLTQKVVNKIAGENRSFYYAARFAEAFNLAVNIKKSPAEKISGVFDFGMGLSPLLYAIRNNNNNPYFAPNGVEPNPAIVEMFLKTSALMGLEPFQIRDNADKLLTESNLAGWENCDEMFISLGTFPYIDMEIQEKLLINIFQRFRHVFIELQSSHPGENNAIKQFGVEYMPGWHMQDVFEFGLFGDKKWSEIKGTRELGYLGGLRMHCNGNESVEDTAYLIAKRARRAEDCEQFLKKIKISNSEMFVTR